VRPLAQFLALSVLLPLAAKAIGGSGKKAVSAQALPQATRDDAAASIGREDELRRRKGAASDIINGTTGTEAALATPGKFVLGN